MAVSKWASDDGGAGPVPVLVDQRDGVAQGVHLHVAAQFEFESKFWKRIIIFWFQALNSRRFQRGFDRVNLAPPYLHAQQHRSEDFLLIRLHVLRDVGQNRGAHEVAELEV